MHHIIGRTVVEQAFHLCLPKTLNPQVFLMKSAKNGARFDVFENGPGRTEQARGIQLDKKLRFVSELLGRASTGNTFATLWLGGHGLAAQQKTEHERVRDQQERDDRRRNVKGGAEFARQKSGRIGLVERVNQVGAAPDIENPDQRSMA